MISRQAAAEIARELTSEAGQVSPARLMTFAAETGRHVNRYDSGPVPVGRGRVLFEVPSRLVSARDVLAYLYEQPPGAGFPSRRRWPSDTPPAKPDESEEDGADSAGEEAARPTELQEAWRRCVDALVVELQAMRSLAERQAQKDGRVVARESALEIDRVRGVIANLVEAGVLW